MSRKIKNHQVVEEHPRIWHDLTQCEIDNMDLVELITEGSPEAVTGIIQKHLEPNQYISVISINSENTTPLQNYLEELNEAGLDVGKGDCEYGYRMPHVKRDERLATELHIFRRR